MRERIHPKEVYRYAEAKQPETIPVKPRCLWTAVLALFELGAACDVVHSKGSYYRFWWRGCLAAVYYSHKGELVVYWPEIRRTARQFIIVRPGQTIPEGTYED